MALTNEHNLPLPIAVFLASDSYNHNDDVVSVTKFIKPIRELLLTDRVDQSKIYVAPQDVMHQYKSRVGTSIHHYIEHVWLNKELRDQALVNLGLPQKTIDKIVVNPDQVLKGQVPVYVEKTGFRDIDGYQFRGTADVIFNGRLGDYKKTSPMSYKDTAKDKKYMLQGSLYRLIMPKLITDDRMDIYEMYEEWNRHKAGSTDYPPAQVVAKEIQLMDLGQTERFVKQKIKLIEDLYDAPQADIPECTDEDLWRKPPIYKYYKNPEKRDRSTGNFDTYQEAMSRKAQDGNVGVVVEVKSKVMACNYCPALPVCDQAKRLAATGEL